MSVEIFRTIPVGPLQVNCYLVGDSASRAAVCIDPGAEGDLVAGAVAELGLDLRAILITHAHGDHIAGVDELRHATGAPVLAPEGEEDLWASAQDLMALFGLYVPQQSEPDRWIQAGSKLAFGPLSFDVLDTRGHSPAGLTFAAEPYAFVGDAVFQGSIGRTDLPGGNQATLVDRIRRNILSLSPDTTLCPGHGPLTTVAAESQRNPYLCESAR
ncbi:MAG TPA: MBL fold metallo-hydrolase [Armatimonadota bacterium]